MRELKNAFVYFFPLGWSKDKGGAGPPTGGDSALGSLGGVTAPPQPWGVTYALPWAWQRGPGEHGLLLRCVWMGGVVMETEIFGCSWPQWTVVAAWLGRLSPSCQPGLVAW